MISQPKEKDIERGKILHDKIKNHEFRKSPQHYLLEEYRNLFKDVFTLFGRLAGAEWDDEAREYKYLYYRFVRDRVIHFKDSHAPDGWFHFTESVEIWSNPGIGILDYSIHDFFGICLKLDMFWDNPEKYPDLIGRFTETSEKILSLLHRILEGDTITKMSFPVQTIGSNEEFTWEMVKNPLYDNDWTLKKYLEKEVWRD